MLGRVPTIEILQSNLSEHQYLFAVNTITCVKSNSFFFYQPPLNLLEWALHPLCYVLPRRRFIKINRYIIKATHLPFLLSIYCFERFYMGTRSMSGLVPLHRMSSFETLANGFNGNLSAKAGMMHEAIKPRSGYRRESIATQAAQHVLDEVFRSSIRGHRNNNGYYYGAVRPATIRPRTADWIQDIPTPMLHQRSTLALTQQAPLLTVSAASDVESAATRGVEPSPCRRKISLASTVFESDEEVSEPQQRMTERRVPSKRVVEEDDGDDEYDEANAVIEDEATDVETNASLLPLYQLQHNRSGMQSNSRRSSPTRKHSSKTGKLVTCKGRRGPERESKSRAFHRRHGGKPSENQESSMERTELTTKDGMYENVASAVGFEQTDLIEKLRSLVADITQALDVHDTRNSIS
jgi:hypothetical protein